MEAWREVWRRAIAPQLSQSCLEALRRALVAAPGSAAAGELLQGQTLSPCPDPEHLDHPPEKACPLALALWRGKGLATVDEVQSAWEVLADGAERRLGD